MASELQGAGEIEQRHEMAKTGNTAHEHPHANVLAQHATIRQRRRPQISSHGRGGRVWRRSVQFARPQCRQVVTGLARNPRRDRKLNATRQGFRKVADRKPSRGVLLRPARDPEQKCAEAETGPAGWLSLSRRGRLISRCERVGGRVWLRLVGRSGRPRGRAPREADRVTFVGLLTPSAGARSARPRRAHHQRDPVRSRPPGEPVAGRLGLIHHPRWPLDTPQPRQQLMRMAHHPPRRQLRSPDQRSRSSTRARARQDQPNGYRQASALLSLDCGPRAEAVIRSAKTSPATYAGSADPFESATLHTV